MSDKSKALRLADALQAGADDPMWADHCEMSKRTASLAAIELRRLHALNAELLIALHEVVDICSNAHGAGQYSTLAAIESTARAAIAKVGEIK